jgi:DNA mismatch repair protein MutL
MRVLGQVRRMLIVCEADDALHVIDQHAADERVKYDALRKAHERGDVTQQRLLFPERVEVDATDLALVEERHDDIAKLGLDVGVVGSSTLAVHAVPQLLHRAPPARLLRDVLDELSRLGDRAYDDALDTALATMACHGSIRAGDELTTDECTALLRSLDAIDDFAGHCPHGRPVVYSIPLAEVERRLGR